jgi:hypothetical protein
MPDIDPVTKLARRLGLDPTLLAAQAQSVGVVVVDVAERMKDHHVTTSNGAGTMIGLRDHHIETIDLPLPDDVPAAIASVTPYPPDAGTWHGARWLAWARWHTWPGESIPAFTARVTTALDGAAPQCIYIFRNRTFWRRDDDGRPVMDLPEQIEALRDLHGVV